VRFIAPIVSESSEGALRSCGLKKIAPVTLAGSEALALSEIVRASPPLARTKRSVNNSSVAAPRNEDNHQALGATSPYARGPDFAADKGARGEAAAAC
jgi:hypothetical protein